MFFLKKEEKMYDIMLFRRSIVNPDLRQVSWLAPFLFSFPSYKDSGLFLIETFAVFTVARQLTILT